MFCKTADQIYSLTSKAKDAKTPEVSEQLICELTH